MAPTSSEIQGEASFSDTSGNTGDVNRTLALVIFFFVLLVLVLAILGGRNLFRPDSGWGHWSEEVKGPCRPGTSVPSGSGGTQWSTSICIPNVNTGRGCLDEDGMQTFIPRRKEVNCLYLSNASKWKVTRGDCIPPTSICTEVGRVAGTRSVKMECISTGTSGRNGCTLRRPVKGSEGVKYVYGEYRIGESVEWSESCYGYQRRECSKWYVNLPSEDGARWTEASGTSRMEGVYIPSSECITGDDLSYSILEEGMLLLPVSCGIPSEGTEAEGEVSQQLECAPLDGTGTEGGIECEKRTIMPWQLRTGQIPPSFNNLACVGTYGRSPYLVLPCRYLPLDGEWPQYGRGADFDLLVSSLLLLFTDQDELIIPSPSVLRGRYGAETSSSFPSPSSPTPPIPLVAVPLTSLEGRGSSVESVTFNTGILALIAPRSLASQGAGCVGNVALLISVWQRGWLSSPSGTGECWWKQMASGPRDPGITTSQAERYIVQLQGGVSRQIPQGYSDECSGTATLAISREDGSPLSIVVQGEGGVATRRNLSRMKVILFPSDVELCTRAIQGPESDNLLLQHLPPYVPEGCEAV